MDTTKQPHSSLGTNYSPFHCIWSFCYLIDLESQLEKGFPYFTKSSKELIEELVWCVIADNDGYQTYGWLRLKSEYPVTAWAIKEMFHNSEKLDVSVTHYGSATNEGLDKAILRLKNDPKRVTEVVVVYPKKQ